MKEKFDYEIQKTSLFEKLIKELEKDFKNIQNDIDNFIDNLDDKNKLGVSLGGGVYKARVANSDKNRGKSAGYRVITYLRIKNHTLDFVYIYDKSKLENITEEKLDKIILEIAKAM